VWSDRYRALRILVGAALAIALGLTYAWQVQHAPEGWVAALAQGARADGHELRFSLWEVMRIDGPRRFEMSKVIRDVPVEADTEGLRVGDTVSVVGRYRASDQTVVAEILENHRNRRAKEVLGWLGFVLSVIAAPFGFRWREGRLWERG